MKSSIEECAPDNPTVQEFNITDEKEINSKTAKYPQDNAAVLKLNTTAGKEITSEKLQYICEVCNKEFITKYQLMTHICYKGEKPFMCADSEKEFSPEGELAQHIQSGEKQFSCIICSKTFFQRKSLVSHIKMAHTSSKSYSCHICLETFSSKSLLNEHVSLHPEENAISCNVCHESFFEEKRPHCCIHSKERKFCCEICSKKFTHKCVLLAHIQLHTGEKPYSCDVCQTRFTQKSGLTRHYKQKHSIERPLKYSSKSEVAECISNNAAVPKLFIIDEIEIKSETADYIPDNAELYNKDEKEIKLEKHEFKCDVCDQEFSCNSNLMTHVCYVEEKPFTCADNEKEFFQKCEITQHTQSTHSDKKQFSCIVCSKHFSRKTSLDSHVNVAHTGSKSYSCPICLETFSSKILLNDHVSLHPEEKAISCNVCHESIFEEKTHQCCIRPKEKKFSCDYCSEKFITKAILLAHIQLHTGEKPYSCNVCQTRFIQQSGLTRHYKQKHSIERPLAYSCKSEVGECISDNAAVPKLVIIEEIEMKSEKADSISDNAELYIKDEKEIKSEKLEEHSQEKAKACDRSVLNEHARLRMEEKTFSCVVCCKSFLKKKNLTDHLHNHSKEKKEKEKKFSCEYCCKKFSYKFALVVHNRQHTGEKPYTCNVCQQQFVQKSHLSAHHGRKHPEKKGKDSGAEDSVDCPPSPLFTCHVCQELFTTKGRLARHHRFEHSEKTLELFCKKCLKSFTLKKTLINHICVPPGEKPFKCDMCSRTFSRRGHLTLHKRISQHHTGLHGIILSTSQAILYPSQKF